jgi:hypothetical protein
MRRKERQKLMGGEPRILEDGGVYTEFCCDCELSHLFTVDIDFKKKEVAICYFRDDWDTKRYRRESKIVIYQRKRGKNK